MRNLIVPLMIFLLAAPGARAAAGQNRNGTRMPTAQQPPKPAEQATDIKKLLCKENPFQALPPPKNPSDPANLDPAVEFPDSRLSELKFKDHCELAGTRRAQHCDEALGLAYLSYYRGKRAFDGELKSICDSLETEMEKCKASQSQAIECSQNLYRSVGEKFNALKTRLDDDVTKLKGFNNFHLRLAKQILGPHQPQSQAGRTTVPGARISTSTKWTAANSRITKEAISGGSAALRANQSKHTHTCVSQVGDEEFCAHITAAADSKFYAITLSKVATQTGQVGTQMASLAPPRSGQGSDITGGDKKNDAGLLDSVGGLDGLMKMATLGMMGAGMYCQMSGQCGNQASKSSLTEQPATNSGLGATSPTPSSSNPGPQTSPLDNTDKKGGSTTPPAADSKPNSEPNGSPTGSFAGGSGFSSGHGDPEALNNFKGDLGRGPASAAAPSPGGGGPGGGSDSQGASAPGDHIADASKGMNADIGSPGGMGGGGLPAPGGFNLSSSPDAPPADAALKNILNGDTAPSDPGLAPLDDPNSAGLASEGGVELQDSESLFYRVKDTHVRCMKRGCVGKGIGEKI